jgi:hypothetical protein
MDSGDVGVPQGQGEAVRHGHEVEEGDELGRQLDALVQTWLVDTVKPATGPNGTTVSRDASVPPVVDELAEIHKHVHQH